MLGILSPALALLLLAVMLVTVLSASFFGELVIIGGNQAVVALVADMMRYCLALLLVLLISASVAEDFEFRQFERLLAMPIARWQYIAAQVLVIVSLCGLMLLPVILMVTLYGNIELAVHWAMALWLELVLLGMLTLLAIVSLEKLPYAVLFTLAIYLLSKLSGLISVIVTESVRMAEESPTSLVVQWIFNAILYVLPDLDSFADNNLFFETVTGVGRLGDQGIAVLIYSLFLLAICLFDFYRKEFNL